MEEKCITDQMVNVAKTRVLSRYPRAITEYMYTQSGCEVWQIWNCPRLPIWAYDDPNTPARILLGLGRSESDAWINADMQC
jgi:hypothetical protein